ncbi:hypothetical protein J6590_012620 [Homalodisca vitripennis]|nr:hypothetical protein J6590_012620 [Homalodisca vitripennis]
MISLPLVGQRRGSITFLLIFWVSTPLYMSRDSIPRVSSEIILRTMVFGESWPMETSSPLISFSHRLQKNMVGVVVLRIPMGTLRTITFIHRTKRYARKLPWPSRNLSRRNVPPHDVAPTVL